MALGESDGVLDLPIEGGFDEESAERAPLAGFGLSNASSDRPVWFVVRSWNGELPRYRNLARHLGPHHPILTVPPPEGSRKEDFPRTVAHWRDFCLDRLRPALAERPRVLLGGWSFGGVLALEVARQLEREGREVPLVAMLDTRLPKAHPEEKKQVRSLPHAVADHAVRYFETPREDRRAYLMERWEWQRFHVRRRLGEWTARRRGQPKPIYRRPDGKTSEGRDATKMTLLQKALWVAYLKYQPRPCTVPVAQFWCAESCEHVGDSSLGWGRALRGPFESIPIPGDHLTLFDDPHGAVLAGHLRPRLAAAGA